MPYLRAYPWITCNVQYKQEFRSLSENLTTAPGANSHWKLPN